jgi:hypothetical protein
MYVNEFGFLELVSFFRLFTCDGDLEYTAVVIQNIEARRLEYFPDCHLAQISLRKGAGEHVLHCNGSFKEIAIPRFEQKCSAAFFLYIL